MNKNIEVSIIVPIFKVPEEYLRKCLNSLISQTLREIEIILVDDGSPDICGVLCDEYADLYQDKVTVIHQENKGLSAARNEGVRKAKGNWIMFVDGDDWIDKNTCEVMYQVAIKECTQLVMCGCIREYRKSSKLCKCSLTNYRKYIGVECRHLQRELLNYKSNIATAYAKLFNAKLLKDHNIFHDEKLKQGAEGLEFNIRVFEKIESVIYIDCYFYHYRYNEYSISSISDDNNNEYVLLCYRKIEQYIENSQGQNNLEEAFQNRFIYAIVTIIISGFYNPDNQMDYCLRKEKCQIFMNDLLVQKTIKMASYKDVDIARRIVIRLANMHLYFMLFLCGKVRRIVKGKK